jgi:hypothetical protein
MSKREKIGNLEKELVKMPKYYNLYCKNKCEKIKYNFRCNKQCDEIRCYRIKKRNSNYCKQHHLLKLKTLCSNFKKCGCRCENSKYNNIDYCINCYKELFKTDRIPIIFNQSTFKLPNDNHYKKQVKLYIEKEKKETLLKEKFKTNNYFNLLPPECLIKILYELSLYNLKILIELNIPSVINTAFIYMISNTLYKDIIFRPFIYRYKLDEELSEINKMKIIIKHLFKINSIYYSKLNHIDIYNMNYLELNDFKDNILDRINIKDFIWRRHYKIGEFISKCKE